MKNAIGTKFKISINKTRKKYYQNSTNTFYSIHYRNNCNNNTMVEYSKVYVLFCLRGEIM